MSLIEPDANGEKKGHYLLEDETLRILADFTYDWEYWITPDGKIIYCSPSSERITGYSPQDFIKNPQLLHEIIHPDDQPLLGQHFQKTYPEDETNYLEFRIKTRRGDVRWISHACKSVFDENKNYLGCRVSDRDVTDQKLAEIALQKSEEKYRTLFETMTQGVVYQDVHGHITSMNPAAEIILGYGFEDILSRKSDDPLWGAVKEDGTYFPGEEHPSMVALKTGKKVQDVVMGIKKPSKEVYTWLNIDAIPLFRPGEKKPYQVYTIFEDITSRREVEEALIEKERKLKVLYETLPLGVSIVDENREVLDVNPALETILKLSKEDLLRGEHEKRRYVKTDGKEMSAEEFPSSIVLQGRDEIVKEEIGVVTEDGETIWTNVVARSLPFPDWKALVLTSDITQRKNSEDALKESERNYRELVHNSLVGIFKSSLEGDILFANEALARIFGYGGVEELRENNIKNLYKNREDRDLLLLKLQEDGNLADYELEMVGKDGQGITLLVSANLKKDVISGMFMDITRGKLAEKRLRESEERYRSLFNQMTEGFAVHEIICDPDGEPVDYRFLDINPAFEKLTGLSRDKVVGKLKSEVVPKDNVDWTKIYGKVALTGRPIHLDDYSDTLKRHYDIYAYSPKPNHFAVIFSDITKRKVAEESLQVTLKRLEKSNYDLEQFAYVASHDLQEPLRMITSFLQLLQRRYGESLDADANEFIGFAVDGAARMQKLINDLLTFSRLNTKPVELREINTEEVLEQVIFESKIFIENNSAVITHDPLPAIYADFSQMTQLFQNLIVNAIKYRGSERPKIHISAKRGGEGWLFSVQDNGMGIEENQKIRIFKIFQRLHGRDEYEGTGIGLAIAKRIVERHGGTIWVESDPGKGSIFYFNIPQEVNYAS
jgi:PAS domain S-box-containing protein